MTPVRRIGAVIETIHAVVYFAQEPLEAYEALGLRGYWRGYFASRAAALGPAGHEDVTLLFGGFAPAFVARALPEVWSTVTPAQVLAARTDGAAAALRRMAGEVSSPLAEVVENLECIGRPMAEAQLALPRPADPVAALWHDCTVLREHRGDGHLAALASHGLQWPVPHLLAADRVDPEQQSYRGWTDDEWAAARDAAFALGPALAEVVEQETDELAAEAYEGHDVDALIAQLEPVAQRVVAAAGVPYPNAMGLRPL